MKPGPKSDLRERLIASAIHVLTRRGLAGLSLREVTRHAGVSANAAYRHFEDRDSLLAAVADEGYLELRERFEACLTTEASRPYGALLNAYFEFARERTSMHELMTSAPFQPGRYHDRRSHEGRRCLEILVGAIRSESTDEPPEGELIRRAVMGWIAIYGLSALLSRGRLDFVPEGSVPDPDEFTRTLLRGYGRPDG